MMTDVYLEALEIELRRQMSRLDGEHTRPYHEMLTYHMGWTGEGSGSHAIGKRIRPLFLLLSVAACEKEWLPALPAAAAIEIIHNFSLIHDDIEDRSESRRGRIALWKKWGLAQGVNAGDGMFALSTLAILDLARSYPSNLVVEAIQILGETSLELTRGQYLDIDYENRTGLEISDYWPMIRAKTAALLSASCRMGAALAEVEISRQDAFGSFGHSIGLAFQVKDDILGIWGEETQTGKPTGIDLIAGKKSYPVLYALAKHGPFAKRWQLGPITSADVPSLQEQLIREGALLASQEIVDQMTDLAIRSLQMADPHGRPGEILFSMATDLLRRQA